MNTSASRAAGTQVMGIVNVTPDSFSDGGRWLDPRVAIAHGEHLLAQGATILDVGGESTRPGAARVPEQVELDRVLPVIAALAHAGATVSIDTMRAAVAAQALDAGAQCVNDVSGGLADPGMAALVAERGCDVVLNHWRGHAQEMEQFTSYGDVVTEVWRELQQRIGAMRAAGVADARVIIDPGLGYSKDAGANWRLLAHLDRFVSSGFRVLVGASRKRFLGEVLARDGIAALPTYRDAATAAVTALATDAGVWGVRVHDAASSADAVRVVAAVHAAKADTGDVKSVGMGDVG